MRRLLIAALFAYPTLGLAHGENAQSSQAIDYSKAEQTAFGIAADPKTATRTIRIDMTDAMRFTPSEIMVKRGEVVRFVAANKGQVLHEMVLGTREKLDKHAALMKRFPGMEHDEPHMAHVEPGKAGEIGWKFTHAGDFHFGCLIPGHFEAGMIGKVVVK